MRTEERKGRLKQVLSLGQVEGRVLDHLFGFPVHNKHRRVNVAVDCSLQQFLVIFGPYISVRLNEYAFSGVLSSCLTLCVLSNPKSS